MPIFVLVTSNTLRDCPRVEWCFFLRGLEEKCARCIQILLNFFIMYLKAVRENNLFCGRDLINVLYQHVWENIYSMFYDITETVGTETQYCLIFATVFSALLEQVMVK